MSALPDFPATVPSGLPCCDHLHWGDHFCHVYETRDDLVDTLVPFFAQGLANAEKCLWVTCEPLDAASATAALTRLVPDLPHRIEAGQIQIIDYEDWYTPTGDLDENATLQSWVDAEQQALDAGWSGLRLTGNVTFLKTAHQRRAFHNYEARVSETFAGRRIVGLCSYRASATNVSDLLDVVRHHHYTLARRDGRWEVLESGALQAARRDLTLANRQLEKRVAARTSQLSEALAEVEHQKAQLEHALVQRDESRRQLEQELEDARVLQDLSAAIVDDQVDAHLFDRLVETASKLLQSDFATMQRLDRASNVLELIASRGLTEQDKALWRWVKFDENTSCGLALRGRERSIIESYATDPRIDDATRAAFAAAGIAAAQSTPLVSRSGEMLGMISTHWSVPHRTSERSLRLLDLVARQAADLLERAAAIEALNDRTAELVEADRRKDEFLATLAHELRNPLAPLNNGVALLKAAHSDAHARVLPMMERQLGHMVRLVDDLLDVSRVSRGAIVLDRQLVPLQTVIQTAIETSRPLIDAAGHAFGMTLPGLPLWVNVDLTRLAQVLANVLNNAAKYTPDGGRITLTVALTADDIEVRIQDTGVGIPPPMLKQVFELFTQVDTSLDRSMGGLGLGLSLSQHLVEMHDGSIRAESEGLGKGSTFVIRLPAAPAPHRTSSTPAVDVPAQPSRRIMVVDDNADAGESLGLLFQFEGHTVHVLSDATRAVDEALRFRPDAMFIDLGMPGLDGYRLAELVREQDALRNVRLIAVSGWGAAADRKRSHASGIDVHLTKPANIVDLRKAVSRERG